jgi:hypothetical protein
MTLDTSGWSGDGDFTIELVEILKGFEEIASLKVEDAPASRSGAGFNFLVNEIFVTFATATREVPARWLGIVPTTRRVEEPLLTLPGHEARLTLLQEVGPADYTDEGMLQYLRTQRIIPPYQTRGYKLVEMVRVYEARPGQPPVPSDKPA